MLIAATLLVLRQDSLPSAGEVVSKMIARYNAAKAIKGDMTTTVKIGTQEIVISTIVQLERPGKLYLNQSVPQLPARVVTSDGKQFSYQMDTPAGDRNSTVRLVEDFVPGMGLGDIYRAAAQSLAERSTPLDLIISDKRDLVALRDQWATMKLTGEVDVNGEKAYRIVGTWRINKVSEVTANFGIFVTPEGDLKKFVIDQIPGAVKLTQNEDDVAISRTTTVNVKVDPDLDQKLFTLLK